MDNPTFHHLIRWDDNAGSIGYVDARIYRKPDGYHWELWRHDLTQPGRLISGSLPVHFKRFDACLRNSADYALECLKGLVQELPDDYLISNQRVGPNWRVRDLRQSFEENENAKRS